MKVLQMLVVVAIAAVCTAAILDHRTKNTDLQRARVDHWFCEHRRQRCDAASPQTVESGWTRRELGYAGAVVVLAAAGVAARRRGKAHRSEWSPHSSGE